MPSEHTASIDTTDTLKGVAISAVLMNHYMNLNISADWSGFAYQWVSVFFLLSGYGLFYSFEKRFHETITVKKLFTYYYGRLVRIFPLLWIAWFIQFIISRGDISYWIPLGINASGHYWFIPALLQCYLLSPLLYWSMKKNVTLTATLILIVFIVTNILFIGGYVPHIFMRLAKITNSKWMEMYFFHIIIFTGGLLIPTFLSAKKPADTVAKQEFHSASFWVFTLFIIAVFALLKYFSQISPFFRRELFILPLIMIIMLSGYALRYSIHNSLFKLLGRMSYSLYLFHMSYYLLVSNLGGFPENSLTELLVVAVLFPVFIFLCRHIEQYGNFFAKRLKSFV